MHHHCFLAAAAGLVLVPAAAAQPDKDREIDALRSEVAELRATVAELKANQDPDRWLTEARADEIRALVADVLADADTRASLLGQGVAAGHDGKFFIASADGNFRLEIGGQIQFRFAAGFQDNSPDGKDTRWGFGVRRPKINLGGHIIDPSWEYYIQGGFDSGEDGEFELEDAFIDKSFENGLVLRAGQFKPPFLREELVSSKRTLAVERSLVNETRNQDRVTGAQATYESDSWRIAGSLNDGIGRKNKRALSLDPTIGLTGRAEFLVMGDWKQFKDFTSARGSETGVLIGAAAHYEYTDGSAGAGDVNRLTWTIDTSWEFSGVNLFAYVVGNHVDSDGVNPSRDQFGAVIQGGVYIADDWETFARYEWGDTDTAGEEDLSLVTVGINHYIVGHAVKWTSDIGYAFNAVSATFASSGAAWREDATGEDGQIVIRSQLQLVF